MSGREAKTYVYVRNETAKMLRKRGVGKKCVAHKKPAKFGVLWADGRGVAFFHSEQCFLDWEAGQGKWAEVVQVTPINR